MMARGLFVYLHSQCRIVIARWPIKQTLQTFLLSLACFICFALVSLLLYHLRHSAKTSLFAPQLCVCLPQTYYTKHLLFTMPLSSHCIPSFFMQVTCLVVKVFIIVSPSLVETRLLSIGWNSVDVNFTQALLLPLLRSI